MPISPGSIVPADTLVTPIAQQLALVAQQIQGIDAAHCYVEPPDNAVVDGSVLFPLREWNVEDDTNGKLKVRLVFEVLHLFRRSRLDEDLAKIYAYVPAWYTVLTAASNNGLNGLAISIGLVGKPGTVREFKYAGMPYLAISNMLFVLTEFNINQS